MQQPTHPGSRSAVHETATQLLLRMPTVIRITGLGRSTIYRLIGENKFPGSIRVGNRAVACRQ